VRLLALPFLPNRGREEDVPGSAQPPSGRCCPAPPLPSPNRRPRSASPRGSTALQLLAETDAEAHRSASGRKGGARASHRAVGEPIAACRDAVVGEPPRSTLRQARQASRSCFVSPGDETADFRGGEALIEAVPEDVLVISERAFDAGPPQGAIEAPAAVPHVRSRANLHYKSCPRSPPRRGRNAIEQVLRLHNDFARVATRYDRVAALRLAAVRSLGSTEGHIAAVVALWL